MNHTVIVYFVIGDGDTSNLNVCAEVLNYVHLEKEAIQNGTAAVESNLYWMSRVKLEMILQRKQ